MHQDFTNIIISCTFPPFISVVPKRCPGTPSFVRLHPNLPQNIHTSPFVVVLHAAPSLSFTDSHGIPSVDATYSPCLGTTASHAKSATASTLILLLAYLPDHDYLFTDLYPTHTHNIILTLLSTVIRSPNCFGVPPY